MTEKDYVCDVGLELGPVPCAIPSSIIQETYSKHGSSSMYLPNQHHQVTAVDWWGHNLDSFGTADILSRAYSTANMPPTFPEQAEEPVERPSPTSAIPLPPKRGRGRPRKNEFTPRTRKKVKTSLPSPSESQTSSQEMVDDTPQGPRGPDGSDNQALRGSSPLENGPDSPPRPQTDEKLDCRRGRNREAAQKCRARKQNSTQKLVADVAAAEAINESLRRESNGLREETLLLKNMVLQHGKCDSAYIQAYIKNAATRLTQGDGELAVQPRSSGFTSLGQHTLAQAADEDFFFA